VSGHRPGTCAPVCAGGGGGGVRGAVRAPTESWGQPLPLGEEGPGTRRRVLVEHGPGLAWTREGESRENNAGAFTLSPIPTLSLTGARRAPTARARSLWNGTVRNVPPLGWRLQMITRPSECHSQCCAVRALT